MRDIQLSCDVQDKYISVSSHATRNMKGHSHVIYSKRCHFREFPDAHKYLNPPKVILNECSGTHFAIRKMGRICQDRLKLNELAPQTAPHAGSLKQQPHPLMQRICDRLSVLAQVRVRSDIRAEVLWKEARSVHDRHLH